MGNACGLVNLKLIKNNFLDWLFFDRRHRVTHTTNSHRQKIYTAKNQTEQITFGKATRASPLTIRQVIYKPDGMPDIIKYFATFAECVRQNTKRRAKH